LPSGINDLSVVRTFGASRGVNQRRGCAARAPTGWAAALWAAITEAPCAMAVVRTRQASTVCRIPAPSLSRPAPCHLAPPATQLRSSPDTIVY
jgi:hypothetical protein